MILAMITAKMLEALIIVESGGDINAIGDKGKAWGCLQIQQVCLDDVNRIQKKVHYTKKDCFSKAKSVEIAKIYLDHYGKNYERRTGLKPTFEVYARIWNGGPNGYRKRATVAYSVKAWKAIASIGSRMVAYSRI